MHQMTNQDHTAHTLTRLSSHFWSDDGHIKKNDMNLRVNVPFSCSSPASEQPAVMKTQRQIKKKAEEVEELSRKLAKTQSASFPVAHLHSNCQSGRQKDLKGVCFCACVCVGGQRCCCLSHLTAAGCQGPWQHTWSEVSSSSMWHNGAPEKDGRPHVFVADTPTQLRLWARSLYLTQVTSTDVGSRLNTETCLSRDMIP